MRYLLLLITWLGFARTIFAQTPTLTITNPGSTPLVEKVVEIPWTLVRKIYPQVDTAHLKVVRVGNDQEVAYQLEHRGEKAIRNLLVQVSLEPKQSIQLRLSKGEPVPVKAKTFCRYVPERFDDFAWENDRVAFRIYGAALNGRSDNAYGTDLWAKRTPELVLDKWYKENDYHKDHGEGLDYYHVGLTLGAGDIAVFLNDSLQFVHNYRSWQVLDNGPLRSTFRVTFDPYVFKGITVKEVRTISLDAGSQLSRIQVHMEHTSPQRLPMAVGITLREQPSPVSFDEKRGVMGYWEPQHGEDGTLGVGCVFPTPPVSMLRLHNHALARLFANSAGDIVYYSGGAWDKAAQFTSAESWFAYLRQVADQLKRPAVVKAGK